MNEEYSEGVTGLRNIPCIVFGNGVEIETKVWAKTKLGVIQRYSKDGRLITRLPITIGQNVEGTDIVKVHFVPETSLADRADDPALVPANERVQISLGCVNGFIKMAESLNKDEIDIEGHDPGQDFYMLADTEAQFAAFMRRRLGFKGEVGSGMVWIRASEFASEENIENLKASRDFFEKLLQNQSNA